MSGQHDVLKLSDSGAKSKCFSLEGLNAPYILKTVCMNPKGKHFYLPVKQVNFEEKFN